MPLAAGFGIVGFTDMPTTYRVAFSMTALSLLAIHCRAPVATEPVPTPVYAAELDVPPAEIIRETLAQEQKEDNGSSSEEFSSEAPPSDEPEDAPAEKAPAEKTAPHPNDEPTP